MSSYLFIVFFSVYSHAAYDEVAEWLRRWTANPLCSARVGSNPILVDNCKFSMSLYVKGMFAQMTEMRQHNQDSLPMTSKKNVLACCHTSTSHVLYVYCVFLNIFSYSI